MHFYVVSNAFFTCNSGLKVFTNHLGYRQYFVIDELSQSTPSNTTFASRIEGTDELQEMSVAQYFHNKYHRDVDPNLPCVIPKVIIN